MLGGKFMTYSAFRDREKVNMNTFLNLINNIRTLEDKYRSSQSFWNRRKLNKAKKALNKYIERCAADEADRYFYQVVEFYKDLAKRNLV